MSDLATIRPGRWQAGANISPVGRYGMGGTSYPVAHDPDHSRAWRCVASEGEAWAEVRADSGGLLFRAWRVDSETFAWQTSTMSAPAFEPLA